MNLYIIRHGQTEWNVQKRLQGWKNSNLTKQGMKNTENLSYRLKDIEFDYIYSSPQERAIDTANIIKRDKDIDINILDGLKEIGFGTWEGMDIDTINSKFGDKFETYLNRPHLYEPIDGESFEDIFKRVRKSLTDIINNGGDNVFIVSHGVTIKVLTAIIKDIPLKELYNIPIYEGTALNICRVKEKEIKFIVEGDTSHMD
ncbi:MAG TPA: histidine phosphatase family protein [Tissierellaceae bacterium]|nr:histidine phosphatase family protein [Tissierellaceae bacterium]